MESGKQTKKQEISVNSVSNQDKKTLDGTSFNPVKGEMALWSAVITQALMDAGSESKKPEAKKEKAKAIRWLLGNSVDFQIVCLNAGLDPCYVQQKALEAIGRNCSWRRDSTANRHKKTLSPQTLSLSIKQFPPQPFPNRPPQRFTPLSPDARFIPYPTRLVPAVSVPATV